MSRLPERPNFIFILADDLGYADLGCYGARVPRSPMIDALAASGLRFTQGYSNSPVCSPTRFALLTGRYQYRFRGGAEEPISAQRQAEPEMAVPLDHPTLPSLLRGAGYATALIGKWHIGRPSHSGPLKSGYDEFFGPLGGAVDYFTHQGRTGEPDLYEGDTPVAAEGYLTDLLSERAVQYVERRAGNASPFLLSLHYTAPHWPWQTRECASKPGRSPSTIAHTDGGSIDVYYRMIAAMDEGIGRLVDALRRTGQLHDTLIVFSSDNGGERFSDTWPLIGQKMELLEGGIRVPLIACWPAHIAPGGVTHQVAITMDWVATFLDAAGIAADPANPLDGMSLLDVLDQPGSVNKRDLFWRMVYRRQAALRSGHWKYLRMDGYEYLFDLQSDARERANLARRYPERMADMKRRYAAWQATMPAIPSDAQFRLAYTESELPAAPR
jgi:arylsulfatase A-like enzyme